MTKEEKQEQHNLRKLALAGQALQYANEMIREASFHVGHTSKNPDYQHLLKEIDKSQFVVELLLKLIKKEIKKIDE